MKNQIERASGGAPDAAPHEPDAFEAAWLDYNKAGVAGGWEKVAFVGGFGRGFKAGRESGHVVLLEALRAMKANFYDSEDGLCMECGEKLGTETGCDSCQVYAQAEAASQQAERT